MDKVLGPLPFVIGVTGHRDLRPEDIEQLKKAVGEIIDEFWKSMPHTPMVVLSALAEGADRLVAKVAFEKNVSVIAPLPMLRSVYEEDFDSQSVEEFRSLIRRVGADNTFELPLMDGSTKEDIGSAGTKRDLQYAQLGQYIVLHSHLVLALWDGLDPDKVGGTADVVKMCLSEGRMEEFASDSSWLKHEDECGPVYQVLTPRSRTYASVPLNITQLVMETGTSSAQKKMIYPKGAQQKFIASWQNTERFNKDYVNRQSSIEQERTSSLKMFEATDPGELKRWPDLMNVLLLPTNWRCR